MIQFNKFKLELLCELIFCISCEFIDISVIYLEKFTIYNCISSYTNGHNKPASRFSLFMLSNKSKISI